MSLISAFFSQYFNLLCENDCPKLKKLKLSEPMAKLFNSQFSFSEFGSNFFGSVFRNLMNGKKGSHYLYVIK